MRKAEKVVVSRTPETVHINIDEMPAHESDRLCRTLIHSATEAFKNPKFAAEYEIWLAKRYGKKAQPVEKC
jgi:hypothetical protein